MYAKEDEPQAWEDLIGCIESQGEEDAQCFDGAFGRRVAVRLLYSEVRLLCLVSRFTCKTALFGEPTSGLEPLTCSLRVCGQLLLSVAEVCKSRIDKRFSFPSLA